MTSGNLVSSPVRKCSIRKMCQRKNGAESQKKDCSWLYFHLSLNRCLSFNNYVICHDWLANWLHYIFSHTSKKCFFFFFCLNSLFSYFRIFFPSPFSSLCLATFMLFYLSLQPPQPPPPSISLLHHLTGRLFVKLHQRSGTTSLKCQNEAHK